MNSKKQIYDLLGASQNGLAMQALAVINDPLLNYHATRPVPTEKTKAVYQVREKINQRNGNPIEGFADFLAGLDALAVADVTIHSLQTSHKTYLIVTDTAVTQLVGILKLPVKTNAETATTAPFDMTVVERAEALPSTAAPRRAKQPSLK